MKGERSAPACTEVGLSALGWRRRPDLDQGFGPVWERPDGMLELRVAGTRPIAVVPVGQVMRWGA